MTEDGKPKFFYGYTIVIAAFIITGVIIGTHQTFGVFFGSLLLEFGWTRAVTSGAFSLTMMLEGVGGIFVGRLTDRVGPRMVVVVCGFFLGLGYLLMSQASALWQLYLFLGVMTGIGMGSAIIPLVSTVARWFVKRRGMMTGIVLSGLSVGTMIIPPLVERLISAYGWRVSYIGVGIIALLFVILAAQFLRRDPSQKGLLPYGASEVKEESSDLQAQGFSLRQAIRTRQLWLVSAMYFLNLFSQIGILIHIVIHITGLGFSSVAAASSLAVIGGTGIPGSIIVGNVGDRIGYRRSLVLCFILMAIVLLGFMVAREMWMLYLLIAVWGFIVAGQTVLYSPTAAELFGLRSHGAIFAIVALIGTFGGATGPVVLGHIFDVSNSYQPAFLLCALTSIIGLILALLVRPTPSDSMG